MPDRAHRYVRWLERHTRFVIAASALAVALSAYLVAFHLPLRAGFSDLLPADAPSVHAMDELGRRVAARDTTVMVIVAPDPARREAAARRAVAELSQIDHGLVADVEAEDAETRGFLRAHLDLYVAPEKLEAARDALRSRIADAKLRADPLYVDLDDPPPPSHALDDLRAQQRDALARLDRPARVSADGRVQGIVIRTAFVATDVARDQQLDDRLEAISRDLRARDPGVQVGLAGGVAKTVAEHRALVHGVLLSTLITGLLVALVLLVHLRSARLLALLVANIAAATLVAFGLAALTVGHLNAATAFLGAIIAGNGVNYGILLAARYLEERPRHGDARDALAVAIAGTLRPTLVASLAAAIAYAALGATAFRGFADFAAIGSAGMVVCWLWSFTLLPALVLRFVPAPRRTTAPWFGRLAARGFATRHPALRVVISTLVLAGAGAVTWRYLAHDPYEYDMTRLHSRSPDAAAVLGWQHVADRELGRGLAGLASPTYIALDDPAQAPAIVDQLHAIAKADPMVGTVASILDVMPPDQARRLALLADLRGLVDEAAVQSDGAERDALRELRPPDALRAITPRDLPPELLGRVRERDGRIGAIVSVAPGEDFDENDGRDLIAFARAVRRAHTLDGRPVPAAGASLLFADVLLQIRHDGPEITVIAAIGLVLVVLLVAGRTRKALAVLAGAASGTLAMIAACALVGLRVDFLDFVALPITLGLGIDYAINLAERAAEAPHEPRATLRSTGGTVLVCSLTTIIGYASLLASDNLAIRGFGLASLIGEITCVVSALAIVPAFMALRRRSRRQDVITEAGDAGFTIAAPTRRASATIVIVGL